METTLSEEFAHVQKLIDVAGEFLVNYSFQLLGALVVFVVGWFVARWMAGIVRNICDRRNIDVTLAGFLESVTKTLILAFVMVICLNKFGITITPLIAALGAVAFGASLAIQGPLSNYGAGLAIILSRPFVVGDTITILGRYGVVKEVKLAHTVLCNADGELVTIPNKHIVGEVIENSQASRVVEGVVGIAYADDPEKAIAAINAVLDGMPSVVNSPSHQVGVDSFGDSSINIGYRFWVPTTEYFEQKYEANLRVLKAVNGAGLTIPFPQREVALLNQGK